MQANLTAKVLKEHRNGVSVKTLTDAGYRLNELKDANFSGRELLNGGSDAAQLKNVGFKVEELGVLMLDRPLKTQVKQLKELRLAGFSAKEIFYGYSAGKREGEEGEESEEGEEAEEGEEGEAREEGAGGQDS